MYPSTSVQALNDFQQGSAWFDSQCKAYMESRDNKTLKRIMAEEMYAFQAYCNGETNVEKAADNIDSSDISFSRARPNSFWPLFASSLGLGLGWCIDIFGQLLQY